MSVICIVTTGLAQEDKATLLKLTFEKDLKPTPGGSLEVYKHEAKVPEGRKLEFSKGTEGKAVRVGIKDSGTYMLKYSFKEPKLSTTQGSLEFWFRPVDWKVTDGHRHQLINFIGEDAFMAVDKTGVESGKFPKLRFFFGTYPHPDKGRPKPKYNYLMADIGQEGPEHWYHVVIGWNYERITMQVDGRNYELKVDPKTLPSVNTFGSMSIGWRSSRNIGEGLTDIDSLTIYDKDIIGQKPEILHLPHVTIGRVEEAISIDGDLKDKSWKTSTLLRGFMEIQHQKYSTFQPSVHLAYDDKFLYLAVDSTIVEGEPLVSTITTRDGSVWNDDSVEIFLDPTPENIDYYQLIINSKGTLYDAACNVGNIENKRERAWNIPGIRIANKCKDNHWVLEIAIPFSCFALRAPPKEEKWLFSICRSAVGRGHFSICSLKGSYNDRDSFGLLSFQPDLPRIRIADWGNLYNEEANLRLGCAERFGRQVHAKIKIEHWDHMNRAFIETAKGDAKVTENITTIFTADKRTVGTDGVIGLTITADGKNLYQNRIAYEKITPMKINRLMVTGDKRETLKIGITQTVLKSDGRQVINRVTVLDKNGQEVSSTEKIPKSMRGFILADISKLTPGDYTALVEVVSATGKLLESDSKNFTVFNSPPPWIGNKLGISNKVPEPWTGVTSELRRGKVAVKCWGREYVFTKKSLLPSMIISNGKDYLSEPMKVNLSINNREWIPKDIRFEVKSKNELACTIQAEAGDETCILKAETTVEFDGFIRFVLSLRAKKKYVLDYLTLECWMPPEYSTLFNSGDYHLVDTGLTPDYWQGNLSAANRHFFLGDEDGGLVFTKGSLQWWKNKYPEKQIEILKEKKRTVIRINMVDTPIEVSGAVQYSFGIQAVPARPLFKGYRRLRVSQGGDYVRLGSNLNVSYGFAGKFFGYPKWDITKWSTGGMPKSEMRVKGIRSAWYTLYSLMSPDSPEFVYSGHRWESDPPGNPYGEESLCNSRFICPVPEYRDWYLWALARGMKDENIDGLYFDCTILHSCMKNMHGHGYVDVDGKRQPTVPIRDYRTWMHRIYNFVKTRDSNSPIVIHRSGNYNIPAYSFCDIFVDGESTYELLKGLKGPANYYWLSLDKFRAAFLGQIWGYPVVFLPEFGRAQPDRSAWWHTSKECIPIVRHFIGLCLVHDTSIWAAWAIKDAYVSYWNVLNNFDLDDTDKFIPYWKEDTGIDLKPENKNLVASAYVKPGRALVIVFNNTDKDVNAGIKLDPGKLFSSKETLCVKDAETEPEKKLVEGNMIELTIKKRNYRVLLVSRN